MRAARPWAKTLAIESLESRGMLSATIESFVGDVGPVSECEYAGDVEYVTDGDCAAAPGGEGDSGGFGGYAYWGDSSYDYVYVDDGGYVDAYEFPGDCDYAWWSDYEYASDGHVSDYGYAGDGVATDVSWGEGEGSLEWTVGELMTGSCAVLCSGDSWEPGAQFSFSCGDPWFGAPVASLSLWPVGGSLDSGYLIFPESISPTRQLLDIRFEATQTFSAISTAPTYGDLVFTSSGLMADAGSTGGPEPCEPFPPLVENASMVWSDDLWAGDPFAADGDPAVQRTLSFESFTVAGVAPPQAAGGGANSRDSGGLAAAAVWFAFPNVEAASGSQAAGKRRPR